MPKTQPKHISTLSQEKLIPYFSQVLERYNSPKTYYGYQAVYQRVYALPEQENSFEIYSIHNYPIPRPNSENQRVLKIILSTSNQILISYDGKPQPGVPGHHEMSNSCFFAGNITLNAEGEITKIDHCSAFFRTPFASIAYVLSILANYPKKVAPTLTIEQVNSSGGLVRTFKIAKEQLEPLAMPMLAFAQPVRITAPIKRFREEDTTMPLRRSRVEAFKLDEDESYQHPLSKRLPIGSLLNPLIHSDIYNPLSALLLPELDSQLTYDDATSESVSRSRSSQIT